MHLQQKEVRFIVGDPGGYTSNSWKAWIVEEPGKSVKSLYIACRDNFKEVKVSLHPSGQWRMGFTEEAIKSRPNLIQDTQNRAWSIWNKPPEQIPNVTTAFHIIFHSDSIVVSLSQRNSRIWRKSMDYIDAPMSGMMTMVTIFITKDIENLRLKSQKEIARFNLGKDLYARIITHVMPLGPFRNTIDNAITSLKTDTANRGIKLKPHYVAYVFGFMGDGARFITPISLKSRI